MRPAASRITSTRATPTSQPVSAPPPSNRKRRRLSVESVQVLPSPISRSCGTPGAAQPSRHGTKATTLPSASEATTRSLRHVERDVEHRRPSGTERAGAAARNEFHVRSMFRAAAIAGSSTSSSWWTMFPFDALIGSSTIPDVGATISAGRRIELDRHRRSVGEPGAVERGVDDSAADRRHTAGAHRRVGTDDGGVDGGDERLVDRHVLEDRGQARQVRGRRRRAPGSRRPPSWPGPTATPVRRPRPPAPATRRRTTPAEPATPTPSSSEVLLERRRSVGSPGPTAAGAAPGRGAARPRRGARTDPGGPCCTPSAAPAGCGSAGRWRPSTPRPTRRPPRGTASRRALTSTRSTPTRDTNEVAWGPVQSTRASAAARSRPPIIDSRASANAHRRRAISNAPS